MGTRGDRKWKSFLKAVKAQEGCINREEEGRLAWGLGDKKKNLNIFLKLGFLGGGEVQGFGWMKS